jgi:hypothetical protein
MEGAGSRETKSFAEDLLSSSIDCPEMLDVRYHALELIGKDSFNSGADPQAGFLGNINIVLKQGIRSIQPDKTIAIGYRFLLARLRIDKGIPENGKGSDNPLGANLDEFIHFLIAGAADSTGRHIDLTALGALDTEDLLLLEGIEELASVHTHCVFEGLLGVS